MWLRGIDKNNSAIGLTGTRLVKPIIWKTICLFLLIFVYQFQEYFFYLSTAGFRLEQESGRVLVSHLPAAESSSSLQPSYNISTSGPAQTSRFRRMILEVFNLTSLWLHQSSNCRHFRDYEEMFTGNQLNSCLRACLRKTLNTQWKVKLPCDLFHCFGSERRVLVRNSDRSKLFEARQQMLTSFLAMELSEFLNYLGVWPLTERRRQLTACGTKKSKDNFANEPRTSPIPWDKCQWKQLRLAEEFIKNCISLCLCVWKDWVSRRWGKSVQ